MGYTSKAVFLDIDGTLIFRDRGPFVGDIEQIEAARRQGHRIFLNTGRALANIPPAIRQAPWVNGISCGGGAHILLDGKTIYHKWAPDDILRAAAAHYLGSKKWCIFEGESGLYGVNQFNPSFFVSPPLAVKDKDDFSHKYSGVVITKLTVDGEITGEERKVLGGFFQLNQFAEYFEAIIRGENKAKAMSIMLEAVGIAPEDSIAIGDSLNDIDMIRAAGLGIAMGNACDELKAVAGAVTDDWACEGVGKALRKYVLL
jgi:Cof subfamily protein (haloacid dehalogenase superfamily)